MQFADPTFGLIQECNGSDQIGVGLWSCLGGNASYGKGVVLLQPLRLQVKHNNPYLGENAKGYGD